MCAMEESKQPLFAECDLVKRELEHDARLGLVVDIDETLAASNLYWAGRLADLFGNPEGLTASETIAKYEFCYRVPYWQGDALQWVEEHIKSANAKLEIPAVEGSLEGALRCAKELPLIGYLTGRPCNTNTGTQAWLDREGFPEAPLLAAPPKSLLREHEIESNEWKALCLERMYPWVLGIIDDNVQVVEYLSDDYAGTVFLYNHDEYCGNASTKVVCCPSWSTIPSEVARLRRRLTEEPDCREAS